MRVIDVRGLGWDAALVDVEGERMLLLDSDLDTDDPFGVMTEAMAKI